MPHSQIEVFVSFCHDVFINEQLLTVWLIESSPPVRGVIVLLMGLGKVLILIQFHWYGDIRFDDTAVHFLNQLFLQVFRVRQGSFGKIILGVQVFHDRGVFAVFDPIVRIGSSVVVKRRAYEGFWERPVVSYSSSCRLKEVLPTG